VPHSDGAGGGVELEKMIMAQSWEELDDQVELKDQECQVLAEF
jgi:hypothetical protein